MPVVLACASSLRELTRANGGSRRNPLPPLRRSFTFRSAPETPEMSDVKRRVCKSRWVHRLAASSAKMASRDRCRSLRGRASRRLSAAQPRSAAAQTTMTTTTTTATAFSRPGMLRPSSAFARTDCRNSTRCPGLVKPVYSTTTTTTITTAPTTTTTTSATTCSTSPGSLSRLECLPQASLTRLFRPSKCRPTPPSYSSILHQSASRFVIIYPAVLSFRDRRSRAGGHPRNPPKRSVAFTSPLW